MAMKSSNGSSDNDDALYNVRDEGAWGFPRKLLKQILEKKRQNDILESEVAKWKKLAIKMNQTYRLQRATTSAETIDIS